jgi:MFS family permease
VLGIAGGLGVGAVLGHPQAALVVAALLSGAALVVVLAAVAAEPPPVELPSRSVARAPLAPGLLAFGERFNFGTMSVAAPFLAPPARVGLVLGVFMTASVVALPLARRYALAWGPRRLAVRSSLAFALALGLAAAVDVFASPGLAVVWALGCGGAAGALYASALVLVSRSVALEDRMRAMATVHAAGGAGFALGALCAGTLAFALPGMLVVAIPGIAVIASATLGVWLTVSGGATPPQDAPLERQPVM